MRQPAGGDLSALRRSNQERLLALLLAHGPLHRAGLARRAELSRTTVSTIVGDLMARGLVVASEEAPTIADRDGRAGDSLAVNPTAAVVVGVNHVFNGTWVHVADLSGRELASAGAELDAGARPAERIATSIEILDRLLAEHRVPRERVVGAGVGVPGPVHAGTGVVGVSLPGQPWSHVHAAEEYDRQLGLPVTLENNTRLEAVAEARWGAGAGVRDLLYIGLSQGIASGLILDGRLYRGAVGAAGELGHVSVNVDGPPCGCGNRGCLVLAAGIPAVLAALRPVLGEGVALAEVLDRARAGDRAVEGVFADAGGVVGQALANLCNLLNPDRIVIGGELSLVGELLLEPVRASLRRYALSLVRDVAVVPAGLDVGSRAGALGGAALVLGETPNLVAALNRLAPAGRPA
jgi:predicted NBD/HSP70 family sugar kinase